MLFAGWFAFCIVTTVMNIFPGNIAHGAGAGLGILTGFAMTRPKWRALAPLSISAVLLFGLWGAALGRPKINLSGKAGYEEGNWGYDALLANRDQEAAHWLGDAVTYQPKVAAYWFDLGIAYQRLGKTTSARDAYQRANQLEPSRPEYSEAVKEVN